jgi:hypothetical protein
MTVSRTEQKSLPQGAQGNTGIPIPLCFPVSPVVKILISLRDRFLPAEPAPSRPPDCPPADYHRPGNRSYPQ